MQFFLRANESFEGFMIFNKAKQILPTYYRTEDHLLINNRLRFFFIDGLKCFLNLSCLIRKILMFALYRIAFAPSLNPYQIYRFFFTYKHR